MEIKIKKKKQYICNTHNKKIFVKVLNSPSHYFMMV